MFNTPTMLSWLLLPSPALFLIQVLLPTFVTREVFLWFCHEEPLSIAGRGTLVFDLQGQKIRVFNVLYVPDCTQNLLSISAVTTTGDKLVISHDDIVRLKYGQLATRDSRNLYLSCLKIVRPSTVSRANHSAYSAPAPVTVAAPAADAGVAPVSASALVHARLGHPSPTVVRSALKYPNMPRTVVHDSISCEACLSSKSTRVIRKTC
ncbi:predicted protein [Scheffersomyces stipitis CBS 6054]|uniref:Retrovirus-related Pol polyprotein from transposon TNT 1-94-like beta-barrel domain-containing protein n=1 Tax=Scheffersomyces stipitis (strain ATCC 58785 / CBS 6054 / NBRC 10063 / NRRL Y-11545) TaxID=322104 RepID=A3LSA2_PICST|nr:predicted protein [Scheffersomyces stipitis CBS 6054]ABN65867.2 predicted protein [Scheffersomyces stipitis CBS 6054]